MRKKGRKILLHEATADNDIRYRGPLSYQHFQAMGWLCIAVYAACTLLKFGAKLDQTVAVKAGSILQVLEILGEMSLPLLLIANYAKILNTSEGYRNQLIKNSAAILLLSRGVPLILSGDEFCNSQGGNTGNALLDTLSGIPELMKILDTKNQALNGKPFNDELNGLVKAAADPIKGVLSTTTNVTNNIAEDKSDAAAD